MLLEILPEDKYLHSIINDKGPKPSITFVATKSICLPVNNLILFYIIA